MSVLVDALRRARRKTRVRRQRHDPHAAPYHSDHVAGRPVGGEIAHGGATVNRREHLPTRTSIELQAGLCRIVEVDAAPRRSVHGDVWVRQFVTNLDVDIESPNFSGTLRRMREQQKLPRRAVVTLWGLRSMHRCVRVLAADNTDLGVAAAERVKEEIALLEADGSRATLAVMSRGHASARGQVAREVSLTAASEQQIVRRLEPIVRAGYRVDRVLTPAMALASLARGRADAIPGASFMYVALATRATCIAVVKDGLLLMARELPRGHARAPHAPDDGHESFRETLASELRRSLLYVRHSFRTSIDAVVLCGDFVGLRTLTGPLTAALDVPVQTLDSMTGIDVESVPDHANAFRADIAALRLTVAAGAEREPSDSLISRPAQEGHRRAFQAAAATAAIVVCVAAIVWYMARRPSSSPPAPVLRSAALNARVASTAPVGLQVQPSARLETAATAPSETAGMSGGRSQAAAESAALTHSDGEDIVVDSIFSLSDRRLAVVNGRIASIGDRIGIFVIVDIQPAAIVVESPGVRRRTIAVRLPAVLPGSP